MGEVTGGTIFGDNRRKSKAKTKRKIFGKGHRRERGKTKKERYLARGGVKE